MKSFRLSILLLLFLTTAEPGLVLAQEQLRTTAADPESVAVAFVDSVLRGETQKSSSLRVPGNETSEAQQSLERLSWDGYEVFEDQRTIKLLDRQENRILFRVNLPTRNPKSGDGEITFVFDLELVKDGSGSGRWLVEYFDYMGGGIVRQFNEAAETDESKVLDRHDETLKSESSQILDLLWGQGLQGPKRIRFLSSMLERISNPKTKSEVLYHLGAAQLGLSQDRATSYFEQGLKISRDSKILFGIFLNLTGLAQTSLKRSNPSEARTYFSEAFDSFSSDEKHFQNAIWAAIGVGHIAFNTKQYDEAIVYYRKAESVAEMFQHKQAASSAAFDIGDSFLALRKYTEALEAYERSAKIAQEAAGNALQYPLHRIYGQIGIAHRELLQFELAFKAHEKAIESATATKDFEAIKQALTHLADSHAVKGDLPAARRTFVRLLDLAVKMDPEKHASETIRDSTHRIGWDYGRALDAEEFLDDSLRVAEDHLSKTQLSELLGLKLALQNVRQEKVGMEQTLQRILSMPDADSDFQVLSLVFVAFSYSASADQVRAGELLRQARSLYLQRRNPEPAIVDFLTLFQHLAQIVGKGEEDCEASAILLPFLNRFINGEYADVQDSALVDSNALNELKPLALFFRAQIRLTDYSCRHADDSDMVAPIAKEVIQSALDDIDLSTELIELQRPLSITWSLDLRMMLSLMKKMILWGSGNREGALDVKIESSASPFWEAGFHQIDGEILRELGRYSEARKKLSEAIDIKERNPMLASGGLRGRMLLYSQLRNPYELLVRTLIDLGEHDEALLYSDRSKSRVLLEVLVQKKNQIVIPDSNFESPSPEKKGVTVRSDSYEPMPLWKRFEDHFPNGALIITGEDTSPIQQPAPIPAIDLETTKQLLPDADTVFVQYFIGDEIYAFVLGATSNNGGDSWREQLKWKSFTLNGGHLAEFKARQLLPLMRERRLGYSKHLRELYDLLIRPIEGELKGKKNIVFMPEGDLWSVPFHALMPGEGQFLIDEFTISYTPSLTILDLQRRQGLSRLDSSAKESVLAFGDSFERVPARRTGGEFSQGVRRGPEGADEGSTESLSPLPGARAEATAVQQIYGSSRVALSVSRDRTSKESFLKELPNHSILHIATHGVLDGTDPLNSYLAFSSGQKSDPENRRLTAREIAGLKLDARLVVLSACNSAGNGLNGEGVVGLGWAFSSAGTDNVVASSWRVDDSSTAVIMEEFHRQLKARGGPKNGRAVTQSLRTAMLKLRNADRKRLYRHPYYWAPFIAMTAF